MLDHVVRHWYVTANHAKMTDNIITSRIMVIHHGNTLLVILSVSESCLQKEVPIRESRRVIHSVARREGFSGYCTMFRT